MKKLFILLFIFTAIVFASYTDSDGNVRRDTDTEIKQALVDTQYPHLYSSDDSVNIIGSNASDYASGVYPTHNGAQRKEFKIEINEEFKPPAIIGSFVVESTAVNVDDNISGNGKLLQLSAISDFKNDDNYISGNQTIFANYGIDLNLLVPINNVFIKLTRIDGNDNIFNSKMDDIQLVLSDVGNLYLGVQNVSSVLPKAATNLVTLYYIP